MAVFTSQGVLGSRWGLLPLAWALGAMTVARLGAIGLPAERSAERVLFGAVAMLAAIALGVRALGAVGALAPLPLLASLVALTVAVAVLRRDRRLGLRPRGLVSLETLPVAIVAAGAVLLAGVAATLLPVLHWDAAGYHLPYVNFALQRGTLADVPLDAPYISTYPHAVEHFFVAWRAMLPDDRLVDAAQIPFGLLGAAAVASIARRSGARADHAVAAGLAWLAMPAVFLQLPTNYVDVASASLLLVAFAFALAEPTVRNVLAASIALGLFLGSKPSAPVATALVFAVVAARAWKGGRRGAIVLGAAVALLLGAEIYLVNVARFGNPIWPVKLTLGPLALPGRVTMADLLATGPAAPRLEGALALRLARSWTSLDAPPAFDMRNGGLGAVFLAALPVAALAAVRARGIAVLALALASLASPDPAVPRYILAFPGLVLALAAARVTALPARGRAVVLGLVAVASLVGVIRAAPGLSGEGPPLGAYVAMSEAERARAAGAAGSPRRFLDAVARLGPGDATAFDASLDLPYLAWSPDLAHHAVRIPDGAGDAEADRVLGDPSVRLLIVGASSPVAARARARGDSFQELFTCRTSSCVVFSRL